MVTTGSAHAAERIRIASLHGMTHNAWSRYERPGRFPYDVTIPGFKYNMMDVQAAIGLHQLAALDRRHQRREAICRRYDEAFQDLPVGSFAAIPAGTVHARHLYTILVEPESGRTRDDVADALAEAGVASSVHFPVVHLHRFYADRYGFVRGQFPHAEHIADTVLSLPLSAALSDEQIDVVIDAVRQVFGA
jgi:dTDP-4-amino-4,6-dideoxygalactose transaminase